MNDKDNKVDDGDAKDVATSKVDNAGFISPIIWQFLNYRDDKMDNGGVGVDVATKNNNWGIGGG